MEPFFDSQCCGTFIHILLHNGLCPFPLLLQVLHINNTITQGLQLQLSHRLNTLIQGCTRLMWFGTRIIVALLGHLLSRDLGEKDFVGERKFLLVHADDNLLDTFLLSFPLLSRFFFTLYFLNVLLGFAFELFPLMVVLFPPLLYCLGWIGYAPFIVGFEWVFSHFALLFWFLSFHFVDPAPLHIPISTNLLSFFWVL